MSHEMDEEFFSKRAFTTISLESEYETDDLSLMKTVATRPHRARAPDQLNLQENDIVSIVAEFSDGWCLGIKVADQTVGRVPARILEALPSWVSAVRAVRSYEAVEAGFMSFRGGQTMVTTEMFDADEEWLYGEMIMEDGLRREGRIPRIHIEDVDVLTKNQYTNLYQQIDTLYFPSNFYGQPAITDQHAIGYMEQPDLLKRHAQPPLSSSEEPTQHRPRPERKTMDTNVSLFTMKRQDQSASFFLQRTNQVYRWLCEVFEGEAIGRADSDDLDRVCDSLRSGTKLCELANKMLPNSIPNFHKGKNATFFQLENIHLFVDFCKSKAGIDEQELFTATDLFEKKNLPKVINALLLLDRHARSQWNFHPNIQAGDDHKVNFSEKELEAADLKLKSVDLSTTSQDDHDDVRVDEEDIDRLMETTPLPQEISVKKISAGVYMLGALRVLIKCVNGHLAVRVGGGWMSMRDFLEKNSETDLDLSDIKKDLENKEDQWTKVTAETNVKVAVPKMQRDALKKSPTPLRSSAPNISPRSSPRTPTTKLQPATPPSPRITSPASTRLTSPTPPRITSPVSTRLTSPTSVRLTTSSSPKTSPKTSPTGVKRSPMTPKITSPLGMRSLDLKTDSDVVPTLGETVKITTKTPLRSSKAGSATPSPRSSPSLRTTLTSPKPLVSPRTPLSSSRTGITSPRPVASPKPANASGARVTSPPSPTRRHTSPTPPPVQRTSPTSARSKAPATSAT
ncbi:hypothetical protein PROFUN_07014 [Planoprotostelium fungivorum]|uniref:Uncharacterized protein n=1 Tax=Planoprotostelium fungivorum TaxID=1890364 RepID=A0A2P6NMQ0_9EUKA|nr:hypothetical protein PROFUN_07014 [Planoprotostelium fungivorum]